MYSYAVYLMKQTSIIIQYRYSTEQVKARRPPFRLKKDQVFLFFIQRFTGPEAPPCCVSGYSFKI